MRSITYVGRLFSGLRSSVENGHWSPTGVPTIYRMIEKLDRDVESFNLILVDKDQESSFQDGVLKLEGLTAPIQLVGRNKPIWWPFKKGASSAQEIRQSLKVVWLVLNRRTDLIYIDHANSIAAAVLQTIQAKPILYRLMGVYPAMRSTMRSTRLKDRLLRWAYRRPFAHVVCTQDGSGVEPWLREALYPMTPISVLLNGVDRFEASQAPPTLVAKVERGAFSVLFVGKFEQAKGVLEFVEALALAAQSINLHGIMVGSGTLSEKVRCRIAALGMDSRITITDRLQHKDILAVFAEADTYVSLNRLGNLSNVNLEALSVGSCIVIPEAQPELGIDVVTGRVIPEGAALRFGSVDEPEQLAGALIELASNPNLREKMRCAARDTALKIGTWDDRIDKEWQLMKNLASWFQQQK